MTYSCIATYTKAQRYISYEPNTLINTIKIKYEYKNNGH